MLGVASQARRLGFDDIASATCVAWGRGLLSRGSVVGAARWLFRSDCVAGARALAAALFAAQLSAVRAGLDGWRAAAESALPGQGAPREAPPAWLEQVVRGQSAVGDVCDALALAGPGAPGDVGGCRSPLTVDPAVEAASALLASLRRRDGLDGGAAAGAPLLPFSVRLWRCCRALLLSEGGGAGVAEGTAEPQRAYYAALAAEDWAALVAALVPQSALPLPAREVGGGGATEPAASTLPTPFLGGLLLLGHAAGLLRLQQHAAAAAASAPAPLLPVPHARVVVAALRHLRLAVVRTPAGEAAAEHAFPQPSPAELGAVHAAAVACAAAAALAARVF